MQELRILSEALRDASDPEERAIIAAGIARLQYLDELASMPTAHLPVVTPCAWCLVEQGLPLGEGSHGICSRHAEQVAEQSRARRAARLARVA